MTITHCSCACASPARGASLDCRPGAWRFDAGRGPPIAGGRLHRQENVAPADGTRLTAGKFQTDFPTSPKPTINYSPNYSHKSVPNLFWSHARQKARASGGGSARGVPEPGGGGRNRGVPDHRGPRGALILEVSTVSMPTRRAGQPKRLPRTALWEHLIHDQRLLGPKPLKCLLMTGLWPVWGNAEVTIGRF